MKVRDILKIMGDFGNLVLFIDMVELVKFASVLKLKIFDVMKTKYNAKNIVRHWNSYGFENHIVLKFW